MNFKEKELRNLRQEIEILRKLSVCNDWFYLKKWFLNLKYL